ncbi:MAG: hypothetical protein IPK19_24245 [Chloroflexi bacterium]|nr:hypothetical protein [Chloroflexota bacterium]
MRQSDHQRCPLMYNWVHQGNLSGMGEADVQVVYVHSSGEYGVTATGI